MKRISLTFKITLSFIIILTSTLLLLYFVFYNLFHQKMLASEKEKATLIVETIEPMVAMNYYLGLNDDIVSLSEQMLKHRSVLSIEVILEDKNICKFKSNNSTDFIEIAYTVKHPITQTDFGTIHIKYALEQFNQTFADVKTTIIDYLLLLGIIFILFAMMIRRFLNPLEQIASKLKNYQLNSEIDFSSIRMEIETSLIVEAFKKMILNIKEYTILLERYKYAIDASAIVSKIDPIGTITYVNEEFSRISGYTSPELIDQSFSLVRHPDTPQKTCTNLWETISQRKTWKGVVKNKAKDGSDYYVKSTIIPIYDDNEEIIEHINISHDITTIVKQQEQIARQTTDLLTGLPNRTKLEEDLKSCKTPKFALIALDNFHMIQDYYGHDIGNQTIQETSQMLEQYIDQQDMKIYKLSSGEFGLLVGDAVSIDIFYSICKNVLKKIDDYIVHINEDSFNIHATAGLTYTQENIVSNASLALHHAVATRKSSVVYDQAENIVKEYKNNILWTKNIKNAIQNDRIIVYAQPIVNAKTLQTYKYECLIRMLGEDGSVISPFFFLDIAKKSKLYLSLTQIVISKSFELFSQLRDKSFSINLSVEDLISKENMDFLKSKIQEYDIASQLVLEIVESEEIENYDEVIGIIADLKELGCRISIDDFGTGYSNFAYLMQLNVDYIKIDGSLIKNIDHDVNSQIISHTILDFATQLGLKTVAEFIHSEDVMKYTQEMGVDYLQGFHLGEPKSIDELLNP